MSDGAELIAAERLRQVTAEGWTPEHDAEHGDGSIAMAAASYAIHDAAICPMTARGWGLWPWAEKWWKPSDDPVKNLVRAGALIAAEIDRVNGTAPTEPADELARLRSWKAEAMEVLGVWDQVHDALGSPAGLGQSKAAASLAAARHLTTPTEPTPNGLEPGEIVAIPADLRDASDGVQWECYFAGYWLPVQADDTARRICRPITEEGQS